MKLTFKGKCKNIENLPKGNLPENAVKFKEANNTAELNIRALVFIVPCIVIIIMFGCIKNAMFSEQIKHFNIIPLGLLLVLLFIIPHEFLHAICFPQNAIVEMYFTIWGAFVTSTCPISKKRFIFMSFLPFFILGIIPLVIWLFLPESNYISSILYTFGSINLMLCSGDLMNIYNALRQMPPKTYQQLSGFNSYWFYN